MASERLRSTGLDTGGSGAMNHVGARPKPPFIQPLMEVKMNGSQSQVATSSWRMRPASVGGMAHGLPGNGTTRDTSTPAATTTAEPALPPMQIGCGEPRADGDIGPQWAGA